MKIKTTVKFLWGSVATAGINAILFDFIDNNIKDPEEESPDWAKILRTITIHAGSLVLSALLAEATTKYVSTSVDAMADGLSKMFKGRKK